jgi:rubrerythrin
MESLEAARACAVLDRLAREKEIAQNFFNRIGDTLEDVDKRRWFRRMAQDEKDQRKILVKHRKEMCRDVGEGTPVLDASPGHQVLLNRTKDAEFSYIDVLRISVRAAEEARVFCDRASDLIADRSCRIFLKILAEEGRSHRDELRVELREQERLATAAAEAA